MVSDVLTTPDTCLRGLKKDLDPGGLAVAVQVGVLAAAALPLVEQDPAQVGELDRDRRADGRQELRVPHLASIGVIGRRRNRPFGPWLQPVRLSL
jgi:hypothetical protein